MRVIHVNTYDTAGGAARAVFRLNEALRRRGVQSGMYVCNRESDNGFVKAYQPDPRLAHRVGRFLRREALKRSFEAYAATRPPGYEHFRDCRTPYGDAPVRQLPATDILHLHWIADFIEPYGLFTRIPRDLPVIWTLHDMHPFTGGCHYDHHCGGFHNQCGKCPQLGSARTLDLSHEIWSRKREAFAHMLGRPLHFVSPSRWLADEASCSPLLEPFPVTVVPNGVDTAIFKPCLQPWPVRTALGIPPRAKVVLFTADHMGNRRKGLALLLQALSYIKDREALFLLSVGHGGLPPSVPFPHLHVDAVKSDPLLALLYGIADLFVIPSLQDNLPNTVLEAMACGTPVVGFRSGGVADLVAEGENGYLVPAGDTHGLAEAMLGVLRNPALRQAMAQSARRIALSEYTLDRQATRMMALYDDLLKKTPRPEKRPDVLNPQRC